MNHDFHADGLGYRLRPVRLDDAQFIIDVRLEDQGRNRYIHPISPKLELQKKWLEKYFHKAGDFYFVVENKLTSEPEGLVGIYDLGAGKAEWGRWVIKNGSLAATESLELLFSLAFKTLNLDELYCRTICENDRVVSLHDALGQLRRGKLESFLEVDGSKFDVIEHYVTPKHYSEKIQYNLEKQSVQIFHRNLRFLVGKLEFHHIGLATNSIDQEFRAYRFLGYGRENEMFEDHEQGVRGQFITAPGQPRLELLENLKGSSTLDVWLKNRVKMYHFAYETENIEKAIEVLNLNRIRIVAPMKTSVYFEKRICFLMLSPGFLIELIEK